MDLHEQKLLVTRAKAQAVALSSIITKHNGISVELPLLSFKPIISSETREVIMNIHTYDWLVFTSKNGVEFFLYALEKLTGDTKLPSTCKIAVVGKQTNDTFKKYGMSADLIPKKFVAEDLLEDLLKTVQKTERVLIVKGNLARDVIASVLVDHQVDVTQLVVYETIMETSVKQKLYEIVSNKEVNFVLFTSSSTVRFFVELLDGTDWRNYLNELSFVSIGPITSKTMKTYDIPIFVEANQYTGQGMIYSIMDKLKEDNHGKV